jgi:uncharacterized membrane-anchored protein YhcB (DUF1043 family)
MDTTIVVALFGFLGVALGAIIAGLFQYRKNKADAAQSIVDAATTLLLPYKEEVETLRKGQEILIAQNVGLQKSNDELKKSNEELLQANLELKCNVTNLTQLVTILTDKCKKLQNSLDRINKGVINDSIT